jgi:tetratricopeptide (TPR) repeat protein
MTEAFLDMLYRRGTEYAQTGRYADALEQFYQLTALDPTNPSSWNGLGTALAGLGHLEEALEAFEQVLRLQPLNRFAWNNRGCVLKALKRYAEAIRSFDRAIALDPDDVSADESRQDALNQASAESVMPGQTLVGHTCGKDCTF